MESYVVIFFIVHSQSLFVAYKVWKYFVLWCVIISCRTDFCGLFMPVLVSIYRCSVNQMYSWIEVIRLNLIFLYGILPLLINIIFLNYLSRFNSAFNVLIKKIFSLLSRIFCLLLIVGSYIELWKACNNLFLNKIHILVFSRCNFLVGYSMTYYVNP